MFLNMLVKQEEIELIDGGTATIWAVEINDRRIAGLSEEPDRPTINQLRARWIREQRARRSRRPEISQS